MNQRWWQYWGHLGDGRSRGTDIPVEIFLVPFFQLA
jgi:hypothetical protein